MTEAEWLVCDDPQSLAEHLFDRGSPRKLRLWACACGRDVIHLFENPLIGKVLDLFESVAEGDKLREEQQGPLSELQWTSEEEQATGFSRAVAGIAHSQWIEMVKGYEGHFTLGLFHLASARAYSVCPLAQSEGPTELPADPNWRSIYTAAQKMQSTIARDIFRNASRPVAFNPSWLTSTVLCLANGIYDEKAFDRMPILADALQDGGCDNEDILNHCRQPGDHVRGCWVIDLLTDRN